MRQLAVLLFLSLAVCTHAMSYGSLFTNCSNDYIPIDRMYNFPFPISFSCKNISLPTHFRTKYKTNKFFYKGSTEYNVFEGDPNENDESLCELVGKYERVTSCVDVLCNPATVDVAKSIKQLTNNQTHVRDWVNYCHYCTDTFKNYTSSHMCSSNDPAFNRLLGSFPKSASFCSSEHFGFPLMVNGYEQMGLPNTLDVILCYCLGSEVFSAECSDWTIFVLHIAQILPIIAISLHGLLFIGLTIGSIPKLVRTLRNLRNGKVSNSLPTVFILMALMANLVTYSMVIAGDLSAMNVALSGIAITILILAIASWIVSWYRIVYVAKHHTQPKTWIIYVILFTLLTFTIALVVFIVFIYSYTNIGELALIGIMIGIIVGSVIVIVGFTVSIVWIYRSMKSISDVNVFQTSVSIEIHVD